MRLILILGTGSEVSVGVLVRLREESRSVEHETVAAGRMSPRVRIAGHLVVFLLRAASSKGSAELVSATLSRNILEGLICDWIEVGT